MSSMIDQAAYVTFSAYQRLDVRVILTDAKLTTAGSKWETVDRPRKAGITLWRGRDPVEQDVSVLFDGYIDGLLQDVDIAALDAMSRSDADGSAPPVVNMDGPVQRRDITDWIIVNITWGDDVIRDIIEGSVLTLRQDAVVTLREFIPPDKLEIPGTQLITEPTDSTSKNQPKPKHKFHKVVKGDKLSAIAVAEYGDVTMWHAIAKANNIRDPNHLKEGKVLRLP